MPSIKTRETILKKAIELFMKNGYDQVSVSDICQACGITRGAFYYHYKSKDDILSEYYAEKDFSKMITSPGIAQFLASKTYWEQIWKLYEIILDHALATGLNLLSQFFILKINKYPGFFVLDEDLTNIFSPMIEKAQAAGEIKNMKDPATLYTASQHLIIGHLLDWCINKETFDAKEVIYHSLMVLFDVTEQ